MVVDGHPRIAIIGAGVGGLAAAAFLRRAGLSATVYEQSRQLTEVGAGIVVAPNAARLLRRLGVLRSFQSDAVRLEVAWEFRRWKDGAFLAAEDVSTASEDLYGEHTYTSHRAHLLHTIRSAVPDGWIRLNRRCVSVSLVGGRPRLGFDDGSTTEADVLVGADGIHSIVRDFCSVPEEPTPSGIMAFRALVPIEQAPAIAQRPAHTLWIGPGRHLVHYPVSAGRLVNLVAFAPVSDDADESWTATATVEEFLAGFAGWDRRVTELIAASESVGRWALLDRPPLKRWSHGPITLLGDAAHPMFPFFAQGAAQAIEDAAVLAHCLAAAPDDAPSALERYQVLRVERATRVQTVSHQRAYLNHLPDGTDQRARDEAYKHADPLRANGWIYGYDADGVTEGALATGGMG